MKRTNVTGQTNVGEIRLAALDVGYSLLAAGRPMITMPNHFKSVGYTDLAGVTWLIECDNDADIGKAIKELALAGFQIVYNPLAAARPRYYVMEVWQDIEPELYGPYPTEELRDAKAKALRHEDPEMENGLFPLDIDGLGELHEGSYTSSFLEAGDEVEPAEHMQTAAFNEVGVREQAAVTTETQPSPNVDQVCVDANVLEDVLVYLQSCAEQSHESDDPDDSPQLVKELEALIERTRKG